MRVEIAAELETPRTPDKVSESSCSWAKTQQTERKRTERENRKEKETEGWRAEAPQPRGDTAFLVSV